jgi:hypothetical protein
VRKRRELDLLPLLIAPVDLGEEVIDRARQTIEATVYPEPLYNLACCESLTGRTSDAIAHLRLALDRTERYRDRLRWLAAKYDSDFDPIRDEPEFQKLIDFDHLARSPAKERAGASQ